MHHERCKKSVQSLIARLYANDDSAKHRQWWLRTDWMTLFREIASICQSRSRGRGIGSITGGFVEMQYDCWIALWLRCVVSTMNDDMDGKTLMDYDWHPNGQTSSAGGDNDDDNDAVSDVICKYMYLRTHEHACTEDIQLWPYTKSYYIDYFNNIYIGSDDDNDTLNQLFSIQIENRIENNLG